MHAPRAAVGQRPHPRPGTHHRYRVVRPRSPRCDTDRGGRAVAHATAGPSDGRWDRLQTELAEYVEGHGATVRVLANTAATASVVPPALTTFLAAHADHAHRPRRTSGSPHCRRDRRTARRPRDRRRHRRPRPARNPHAAPRPAPWSSPLPRRPADHPHLGALPRRSAPALRRAQPRQRTAGTPGGPRAPLGSQPAYRLRLPGVDAVCHAVAAGIGIAILPLRTVTAWISDGSVAATATRGSMGRAQPHRVLHQRQRVVQHRACSAGAPHGRRQHDLKSRAHLASEPVSGRDSPTARDAL